MKYAFLTGLIPKQMEDEVKRRSTNYMSEAASALQWHIYEGLSENIPEKITLLNTLPVGSFPQYYSKPFIKTGTFTDGNGWKHQNIGFCNVRFIRNYNRPNKVYAVLKKWCTESDEEKTLFVYTVSAHFMTAVAKIKKQFPDLKVCVIIADLPDMNDLSSNRSLLNQWIARKTAADSYASIGCVDAFVLLTKQMADYMKITKPFTVMEGISTFHQQTELAADDGIRRILYTGTLHKRFGILNLVEAFTKIPNENYRLIICGIGDSEEEIRQYAQKDSRIEFKGQLKRDEVLALQKTARALVNPRQNNEEFTKYSFPSKNLEYLSSGVPLVAYKLDGIPDEYDTYTNYVQDNSVETLRDLLIDVCEDVNGEAALRAQKAAEFVRNEKNAQKQTLKITELLKTL